MDEQAADSTASEGTAGEATAKSPGTLSPPWPSFGAQAGDAGLNDPDSVGAAGHGTAGEAADAEQADQARSADAEQAGQPQGAERDAFEATRSEGGQAGEAGGQESGARAGQPHAFGPDDVVVVKASTIGQMGADRADGQGTPGEEAGGTDRPGLPEDSAAAAGAPATAGTGEGQAFAPGTASWPSGRGSGAGAMAAQPAGAAGQPGRGIGGHQERWRSIQAAFVDDPRQSVSEAADLVAETVGTLVVRAKERERALREEWDTDGADTEALRTALMRYRSFLEELPVL